MVRASMQEVEAALAAQPSDLNWTWASEHVLPVMPRVRPYPPGAPEPVRTMVAPGVAIGFGIDVGPAFINIGPDLVQTWGVSVADVHSRSLVNLAARAASVTPADIVFGTIGDAPTRWLQTGRSIGSVLALLPHELGRLFGATPALFITPMRDLIIGLPADVDREMAARLWHDVAAADPNCLGPIAYRFDGRLVRPESLADLLDADLVLPATPGSAFLA